MLVRKVSKDFTFELIQIIKKSIQTIWYEPLAFLNQDMICLKNVKALLSLHK